MERSTSTLAQRLGKTVHVSPLRFKLQRLAQLFPISDAICLEDWLVDLANARGARITIRDVESKFGSDLSDQQLVSNEELVVGICQFHGTGRADFGGACPASIESRACSSCLAKDC